MPADGMWRRRDYGPVVRPYAVTSGRTEAATTEALDLIDVVAATGEGATGEGATGEGAQSDDPGRFTPEHRRILDLCANQLTVADVASETTLPIGVVRVLLADLIQQGAVTVVRKRPRSQQQPGNNMLQEILNGLRAL